MNIVLMSCFVANLYIVGPDSDKRGGNGMCWTVVDNQHKPVEIFIIWIVLCRVKWKNLTEMYEYKDFLHYHSIIDCHIIENYVLL